LKKTSIAATRGADTLVDKTQESGAHSIAWEAKNGLSSGVYFYQIKATDFVAVRKCLLAK
jgi:hypothetical protein